MSAYIIDIEKFEVYATRDNPDDINMIEEFGPEEALKYILCRDENEAYEYWHLCNEESGEFYEGLGYSEHRKHDMFNDWITNF